MKLVRISLALCTAVVALSGCGQSSESNPQNTNTAAIEIPQFARVADWGRLPDNLVFGTVSGVAVDAHDNVWVLHRPRTVPADAAEAAAPAVVIFNAAGEFIDAWGGPATTYDWPQNEHGIHVDGDDNVWISGTYCTDMNAAQAQPLNDDYILKLTSNGEFVAQFGRAGRSSGNADTENFHRAAAMQVYAPTNEVFIADGYGNHRVIVLDADTGAFRRLWGAYGNTPQDEHRCGPQFFAADAPAWDETQFSIVHGIAVSDDGFVYVADRENGRVQVFDLDGEYQQQIVIGTDTDPMTVAFSVDAGQRFVYVWRVGGIQVYERRSLAPLAMIADAPNAAGPGHMMAADSQGNLYVARLGGGIEKLRLASAAGR